MSDHDEHPEITELLRSEPVDVDPAARARAVAAAVAAYDRRPDAAAAVPSLAERRSRRSMVGLSILGAAAALVVVVGVGVIASGNRSSSDESATMSADSAPATTIASIDAEAGGASASEVPVDEHAGRSTEAAPASPDRATAGDGAPDVRSLGTFPDAPALADAVFAATRVGDLDNAARRPPPCAGTSPPSSSAPYLWQARIGPDDVWATAVIDPTTAVAEVTVLSGTDCAVLLQRRG